MAETVIAETSEAETTLVTEEAIAVVMGTRVTAAEAVGAVAVVVVTEATAAEVRTEFVETRATERAAAETGTVAAQEGTAEETERAAAGTLETTGTEARLSLPLPLPRVVELITS